MKEYFNLCRAFAATPAARRAADYKERQYNHEQKKRDSVEKRLQIDSCSEFVQEPTSNDFPPDIDGFEY